jgi:hypothetical protein
MTTSNTYKRGDSVWIINGTHSGKAIVEGKATVVCPFGDVDGYYMVRFAGDRMKYARFVDPAAQADPHAFVAKLNGYNLVRS